MSIAKTIAILAGTALATFVVNAFVLVPLPRRGLEGGGLYSFVDEIKFYELMTSTAVLVFLVARRLLKHRARVALGCSIGFALLNAALLIVDVRWATYPSYAEKVIEGLYGTLNEIIIKTVIVSFVGIGCVTYSLMRSGSQNGEVNS